MVEINRRSLGTLALGGVAALGVGGAASAQTAAVDASKVSRDINAKLGKKYAIATVVKVDGIA